MRKASEYAHGVYETERILCGMAILDRTIARRFELDRFDFFDPSLGLLWETLCNNPDTPDSMLLRMLRRVGVIDQLGGPAGISRMVLDLPHISQAAYYAMEVIRLSTARAVIEAANRLVNSASVVNVDLEGAVVDFVESVKILLKGVEDVK